MDNSEKKKKFERISKKRSGTIIHHIHILSNLSNRYNYDYDSNDVEELFSTIQIELNNSKQEFLAKIQDDKTNKRDYTKYDVFDPEGKLLSTRTPKGRIALQVIKHYVEQNNHITLGQVQKEFPSRLQNENAIGGLEFEVVERLSDAEPRRYYIKKEKGHVITLEKSQDQIVVTNQWGINNIGDFIKHAQKMGYAIKACNK